MSRLPSAVKPFPRLPELPAAAFTDPAAQRAVERFNDLLNDWFEQVNGRISFGDTMGAWSGHIDGERLRVFATANPGTDFPVAHNLGRVPVGYIVTKAGSAVAPLAQLASTPAATESLVWFNTKADPGNVFEVLLF